jgi:hypothetical protein
MKHVALLCVLFVSPSAALAQAPRPGKDLAFAQIAFGGGYETVLNVTNRGTSAYNGTLTLWSSDTTKPFPARVNGTPVTASMSLALNAGATATYTITSGDASAGTLSGFATIYSSALETGSLLEGNLTYYVKSADGSIVDSVGVAPSRPVFQTVIPFDDFQTVALALASRVNNTVTVTLKLFDDKNTQVGTATQTLTINQQVPKFLYQYFTGVTLTKGRVEIQSTRPILGTALTFAKGGQASSLPFLPSTKLYEFTATAAGMTFTGQVYLAIDFPYVTALGADTVNGVPQPGTFDPLGVGVVTGSGNLELYFRDNRGASGESLSYSVITGFDPAQRTQTGRVEIYLASPPSFAAQGTLTITALN